MSEDKPATKGSMLDKQMPAPLGKVGVKSLVDLLVMIAGIYCMVIVIVQLVMFSTSQVWAIIPGGGGLNGWLFVFYILCIWVFFNVAFFAKLGPFFASKFKSVSGAFSFLRDENDACNFIIIIGAWTAVLNTLVAGQAGGASSWQTYLWFPALALFCIFLLKGKLSKK